MYEYQARAVNVVDGDTIDLTIDLGFHVSRRNERVRLHDVDTAETHFISKDSDEYAEGMRHTRFVEAWLAEAEQAHDGNWPLLVTTERYETGSYGRYLAYVQRKCDNDDLTMALLSNFDSVTYDP